MTEARQVRILFVGDVVGRPGRRAFRELLPSLREEERPDLVVVNAENSAGGFGVDRRAAGALFEAGAEVLTGGNHSWDKAESLELVEEDERVLRPENLAPGAPGSGWGIFPAAGGARVGVLNLIGRIFLPPCEDPFRSGRRALEEMRAETPVLLVDFHGEASSEKQAFAWHVDGLASAVIGTHTHVPTADARVLPKGTAYQTDAGMTGGYEGVIGMEPAASLQRFLSGMPARLEPASRDLRLDATVIDVDRETGRALSIKHVQKRLAEVA
ncbi:MAG: TIGR00282 family metallophosphoesterase [bacterium]